MTNQQFEEFKSLVKEIKSEVQKISSNNSGLMTLHECALLAKSRGEDMKFYSNGDEDDTITIDGQGDIEIDNPNAHGVSYINCDELSARCWKEAKE